MAKSWHNQNQPYEYSQVYNNTTLVRTITKDDSTDIKYIHSYGATRKTGANTDPSEVYCVFDKGSYYLNVYHQPLGTNDYSFEEDGGAINQTDINSYRINGDNVSIYESYTVSSNYASPTSVTSKQGQTNTPLQISHNTTEAVRTGIITVQQVYKGIHYTDTASNALKCTDVEFTQRGKYSYRITISLDSGYSNTIDHDGTTKYTCYLQRKREGGSWANVPSSTSHEINAAWSCSSGNTTRNYGATVTGTVDSSNHYVYHLTVTGCNTRFGTYSGSTISTQNVTITVNYNGNIIYSGSPNSNASNTQSVAVRGVPPYYDYRTYISPTTGTICCDTSRGSYSSTLTFTATFQQCTSTGYADDASSTYGWTSWETVTTTRSDFTWTTTNTTATSITTGVLSITAEYNKYHKADTTTTVKAVINSGVTNNQGVAWGSSKVLSTITATKKDHNNTYYCTNITTGNINILGRADLYEYRVVFVDPVEVVYINDGGTYQCDAKLQERKNLGRTAEDGHDWSDYDSTRSHFTWSIATSNGSLTVNSSGRATGTNKNYYVGQSSATPGYTGGTNQSIPCQDQVKATYNQSISKTDSLHSCAAVISISPNNDNSAYIRTRGYMTVYKFSVTISTPTSATIVCANSGRTGGYSTSHTFTANLVYQYRVGTNTTNGYTWSTATVMTSTGSNFTWTSVDAATNYYTLSNGTCSSPHTRYEVADKTFTITATAISSVYNIYNIESGSTYSATCTLTVLGRADKYQYRAVIVSNTSVQYINDGGTYQCNAKLQQQKNESGTWTDYDTANSHFTWTPVSNNGSITVNTNGLATGTNKNYYLGKATDTPGYTGGTNQSSACADTVNARYNQTINITDTLHNCPAIIIINPDNAITAEIRVRGYITYYSFVTVQNTPTSGTICCNNSRQYHNPAPTTEVTFSVTTKYYYRSGTTTAYSWIGPIVIETAGSDYTWTGSGAGTYYTLDNGRCYNAFDTYEQSDHNNLNVKAVLKDSFRNQYNQDNGHTTPADQSFILNVLAREDDYFCLGYEPTISPTEATIADGGSITVRVTAFNIRKNNNSSFNILSYAGSGVTFHWQDSGNSSTNPYRYISAPSTYGNSVNVSGVNKYFASSNNNWYDILNFDWSIDWSPTPRFSDNNGHLRVTCGIQYKGINIYVTPQPDQYTYGDYSCVSPPQTLTYDATALLIAQIQKKRKDGHLGSEGSDWHWVNDGNPLVGPEYIRGGSNSNAYAEVWHSSGGYHARGTYSGTNTYGEKYTDLTIYYHAADDSEGDTYSCTFTVKVFPEPDHYTVNYNISFPGSMDANDSEYATCYVDLLCNGSLVQRYDCTWFDDQYVYGGGLDDWNYNPPYYIRFDSVDLDFGDPNQYIYYLFSIYVSWGPYNDRNANVSGFPEPEHSGTISSSPSGTITVIAPSRYYLVIVPGEVVFPSGCSDYTFEYDIDMDYGTLSDSGYGGLGFGGNDIPSSQVEGWTYYQPGYDWINYHVKAEWEINGQNYEKSKYYWFRPPYVSPEGTGYAYFPDLYPANW